MTCTEFVNKIREIPSAREVYQEFGLDENYIKEHISRFHLERKTNAITEIPEDDEIAKLVASYNVDKLEIGMVCFLKEPYRSGKNLIFGKFEIDPLAIDQPSGEIIAYEVNTDHVSYRCAANGEKFLRAIYEAGCFLEKCSLDDALYENVLLAEDIAKYCGELAGGRQYEDFYIVMLS